MTTRCFFREDILEFGGFNTRSGVDRLYFRHQHTVLLTVIREIYFEWGEKVGNEKYVVPILQQMAGEIFRYLYVHFFSP